MKMKDKLFSNVNAVKPDGRTFKAFQKRFNTILGDRLDMTDQQLRQIYDGISPYIETSIYAEMEDVLEAIQNAYHAFVNWVRDETAQESKKIEDQSNKYSNVHTSGSHQSFSKLSNHPNIDQQLNKGESFEGEKIQRYINDEKSFNWFVTHVVTNYQSLPKQRIEVLVFKHEDYQYLELQLFGKSFIRQYGFRKAYQLHKTLMHAFYTTFDDLLAKGTVMKTDQAIEEQILAPVLEQFKAKVDAKVGEAHEQAESL
ncbi:hypothetical protein [Virgibacillus salexigens]|uniref:hypothetical protein n=1 Tax=Virgibacillus salexigens TaxID=61016 RepID=UPI00190921E5|nr:hypothetical protein [Virgibacillus salexigens]